MSHFVEDFYEAFKNRNFQEMNKHYHKDAKFWDPVFEDLSSKEVQAMWHMLILRGKETKIQYSEFRLASSPESPDQQSASIKWEALYPYGPKRYPVHNKVTSQFEMLDGKIYRQKDSFDLRSWLGMALGPVGKILGFTSFLQNKVRRTAQNALKEFIKKNPEYQD